MAGTSAGAKKGWAKRKTHSKGLSNMKSESNQMAKQNKKGLAKLTKMKG